MSVYDKFEKATATISAALNLPLGPLDGSGVWEGHLKAAGYRVVWVC